MAKIDEHKILADKLAKLLQGQDEVEVNHNKHGTAVYFDNVKFSYDKDGKSERLIVSL